MRALETDDLAAPALVGGPAVADLASRVGDVARSIADARRTAGKVMSLSAYLQTPSTAPVSGPETESIDVVWRAGGQRLDELLSGGDRVAVADQRGVLALADFLLVRIVELALATDDLSRSVPENEFPSMPEQVNAVVTRTLLRLLQERAPGRAIEVRIPPFAAGQVGEGPRHSRGTPPNVVELSPQLWLQLAAGRVDWSDAVGSAEVSASGARADLSAWLPLL